MSPGFDSIRGGSTLGRGSGGTGGFTSFIVGGIGAIGGFGIGGGVGGFGAGGGGVGVFASLAASCLRMSDPLKDGAVISFISRPGDGTVGAGAFPVGAGVSV